MANKKKSGQSKKQAVELARQQQIRSSAFKKFAIFAGVAIALVIACAIIPQFFFDDYFEVSLVCFFVPIIVCIFISSSNYQKYLRARDAIDKIEIERTFK